MKHLVGYTNDYALICQTLASYDFNAVYVEVNPFEWTGNMMNEIPKFMTACANNGLELHILFLFYGWSDTYTTEGNEAPNPYGLTGADPDWRMVDAGGNYVDWCCLQRTSTRARVKQVIDIMFNYYGSGIAGINFDYVRMPASSEGIDSYSVCYCNECKAAFQAWLPTVGKTFTGNWSDYYHGGSRWADYAEWRCNPINNIIRDVRQWALAKKSNLTFSADVWSPFRWVEWSPDYYKDYMAQDPAYWVSQGWLDMLNPMEYISDWTGLQFAINNAMTYFTGGEISNSYKSTDPTTYVGDGKGSIPLVPFITTGQYGSGVSPVNTAFWLQEIDFLRSSGCNGFIIWCYAGPGMGWPGYDVTPYLAAIRDRTDGGKTWFSVFTQSRTHAIGSTIIWQTSLPTIGKVEYSQTQIFTATPRNGSLLPYVDINYVNGTILVSELTPTQNHEITVPLSPPFYFRIRNADSSVEPATPVYLNTGYSG